MDLPTRQLSRGLALLLTLLAITAANSAAHAQGLFGWRGNSACCGPCGNCPCGSCGDMGGYAGAYAAAGSYGAAGAYGMAGGMGGGPGTSAPGMPAPGSLAAGDQFAGTPLDLGEGAPAQTGGMFASVDSGYIDDARIRTIFRGRFDAGFNNIFPDRAEFFYAQCGCFGNGAPGPGKPGSPGVPATATTGINYQEFWTYYEQAFSPGFSVFIDVPYRLVQFKLDPAAAFNPATNPNGVNPIPNANGFSDLQFGFKYALRADQYGYDTFQLRVYTPTGDAGRGLGTNHASLEPAYLAWRQLTETLRFNGEFRAWIPFSNDSLNGQNFAGVVLRYGGGLTYDLYGSYYSYERLSLVNELVGWSVLGGLKYNPLVGVQSASGDTIVNYKPGLRYVWGLQSIYVGYGVALTHQNWYTDIFRAEYAYRF
jgi:hypothetical protein